MLEKNAPSTSSAAQSRLGLYGEFSCVSMFVSERQVLSIHSPLAKGQSLTVLNRPFCTL